MIFRARGDTFVITDTDHGIEFHVDRLRRDRHSGDLVGELTVYCGILGAKVLDNNSLAAGRFNFSSLETRSRHARFLGERARTNGKQVDWLQGLEEVCQLTLDADRRGEPAVLLRTVPRPDPDDEHVGVGRLYAMEGKSQTANASAQGNRLGRIFENRVLLHVSRVERVQATDGNVS